MKVFIASALGIAAISIPTMGHASAQSAFSAPTLARPSLVTRPILPPRETPPPPKSVS